MLSIPQDELPLLLEQLRQQRVLLVLDNGESLLQPQSLQGDYLADCADYQDLFVQLGEATHQSCVVLTSRELPSHFADLQARHAAVRVYPVTPMAPAACRSLLQELGIDCQVAASESLRDRYGGNPLSLKLAATIIRDLFDHQVEPFLASGTPLLMGVRQLLDQQFERLSPLEQTVMGWLAIHRDPLTLKALQASFLHPPAAALCIEALESLWRRSLIEKATKTPAHQAPRFTQQPVIMEYVTRRLIDDATSELMAVEPDARSSAIELTATLNQYSLLTPTAPDYLCNAQKRLILQPILARLLQQVGGASGVEQRLRAWLHTCRHALAGSPGYAAGNGVNLLCALDHPVAHLDCSGLALWQVDLRGQTLQRSNFRQAHFQTALFTETFGSVLCVAFDATGEWLASGDSHGDIRLWQGDTGQIHRTLTGHTSWVRSLTFHPTRPWLVSASNDHTLKVWDQATGSCLHTLAEHHHWVRAAAFAPVTATASPVLASGDADGVICLWDSETWTCVRRWVAHKQAVRSLALHPTEPHQLV
ncbi:MAG: hypothetical protein AAGA01_18155, partial [Cyanobacteria bacterium P01_E01_bin.43]